MAQAPEHQDLGTAHPAESLILGFTIMALSGITAHQPQSLEHSFVVGEWQVDVKRGVLRSDRREQHLEPKEMAVLVFLARHANQVVSRKEILEAVWNCFLLV